MKKVIIVAALLPWLGFAHQAVAANTATETIWGAKGDNEIALSQVCGGQNSTCRIVGQTKHYAAVLNNKSKSGCAFGDIYIVGITDKVWVQGDTGTCSPNAYIQKGTINNGQYSSVDIVVGGNVVKRFPIGYWSAQKEYSGKNKPRWKPKTYGKGIYQLDPSIGPQEYDASAFERKW
ncbi:hypothetical protein [Providencia sp.]|uniref:hypothetical protein n=1 Tax=Providencia sp. TaxID=589 RepID=UPI0025E1A2B8|nr:hypothetical protein [Providencia sp.]